MRERGTVKLFQAASSFESMTEKFLSRFGSESKMPESLKDHFVRKKY